MIPLIEKEFRIMLIEKKYEIDLMHARVNVDLKLWTERNHLSYNKLKLNFHYMFLILTHFITGKSLKYYEADKTTNDCKIRSVKRFIVYEFLTYN